MQTSIAKWGNSLALRLPRHIVAEAKLKEGSTVTIEIKDDALLITPVRKKYKLGDLLAKMKTSRRHVETDWGEPRGEEAW